MPTEKPRVTFTISQERLSEVEAYRFDNKFKNQTQAILSLIEKGLSDFNKENPPSTTEAAPGEEVREEIIRLAGKLSEEQKDLFLALLRLTAARNQGLPAADLVSAGEAALKAEHQSPT